MTTANEISGVYCGWSLHSSAERHEERGIGASDVEPNTAIWRPNAIRQYLAGLVEAKLTRADASADDLLGALVAIHDEGDRLDEDELLSMAWLLLQAAGSSRLRKPVLSDQVGRMQPDNPGRDR